MDFERAHAAFIDSHKAQRRGERLRRLIEGHAHAEKRFLHCVWWPAFGHFDHLHPEYEVRDFSEGVRFLDFAYTRLPLRLAIEIDGYGPHHQRISRRAFADNLHRQNQLLIAGWSLLRFSYDDLADRPRLCQQEIEQLLGTWIGHGSLDIAADATERDILRIALRAERPVTPKLVAEHMGVHRNTASKWLRGLHCKGWLEPASGTERVRAYRVALDHKTLARILQL